MCLVLHFVKPMAAAALTKRLSLESKPSKKNIKKGVLKPYSHIVHHLLKTYATVYLMATADKDIIHFTQLVISTTVQFGDVFWKVVLRVLKVSDSHVSEGYEPRDYQGHMDLACENSESVIEMGHYINWHMNWPPHRPRRSIDQTAPRFDTSNHEEENGKWATDSKKQSDHSYWQNNNWTIMQLHMD